MMQKAFAGLLLATLFSSGAALAQADEQLQGPVFSINGFGTAGMVRSGEKSGDFTLHALQKEGAGATREWSAKVDSRLGAQLTVNLSPQVSAIVQAVVEQRENGRFDPAIDWATLKYQATPDLSFRVGRVILPLLLYSDNYKVGYAQHWLRAPVEVYRLIPLTSSDGVDMLYRIRQGKLSHTLQLAYGNNTRRAPEGGEVHIKHGWLISDTIDIGTLTVHATAAGSYTTIDVTPYQGLFNGFRQVVQGALPGDAAAAQAILDKYEPDHRLTTFYSMGASYDPGKWFVMSELAQVNSQSLFGKRFAWYATGGYRFGQFVPYLTYTHAKAKSPLHDPGVTSADPAVLALNAGLNTALAYVPDQQTLAIGTRWDFARNAALKVQFDHTRISDDSFGTLQSKRHTPEAMRLNVFSISVDWVF